MAGPLGSLQGPALLAKPLRSFGSALATRAGRPCFQLGLGTICRATALPVQRHSRPHPARTALVIDHFHRSRDSGSLVCRAQAGASGSAEAAAEEKKDNFLARLLRPLRDFGFGRASIWEGGVGLFILAAIGRFPPQLCKSRSSKRCVLTSITFS